MDHRQRLAFDDVVTVAYEPLQRYLRRRCHPDDVDDLLSQVLTVIWQRIDDTPDTMVLPWCYGIARRCLSNYRRGAGRRLRLTQRVQHAARLPTPAFTSGAEAALHDALDRLSDQDREVVRLWAWEQLEPREIAATLDTTANAISVRLTRIRSSLENEIARKDHAPAGHKYQRGNPELNR